MIEIALHTIIFIISLVASYWLTHQYRKYALAKGIIDQPNQRSSHTLPTPRGGGISIVITCSLLIITGVLTGQLDARTGAAFLLSGSMVAIVGLMDDHKHLSGVIRLSVHLLASLCGLLLLPELPNLAFLGTEIHTNGAGLLIAAITLAWLINLYNFMDGIDGIAATEAIATLVGAALILSLHTYHQWHLLVVFTAPLIGFLIWNWSPAKIFMGDGSSGYLGITLGLTASYLASTTPANLWCWAILLGVFIVDSSWTLSARVLTGQQWHQPHRSHCYQILARKFESHAIISTGTGVITLFWLTPIAATASFHPEQGYLLLIAAYSPLCYLCARNRAGKRN